MQGGGGFGELETLALLECGCAIEQPLSSASGLAPLALGELRCSTQTGCRQAPSARVRVSVEHAGGDQLDELLLAIEEHFAFVGEGAKEGAFGQSDGGGDVGCGRLVVAVLCEQLDGGSMQLLTRARLPSAHAAHSSDDSN